MSEYPQEFEQVIRRAGEGWLLDNFPTPDEAMNVLRKILADADKEYRLRFNIRQAVISMDELTTVRSLLE